MQHNQERAWILELLVSGLRCEEDYVLYRRKGGVFSQVMALHDSPLVDRKCKVGTCSLHSYTLLGLLEEVVMCVCVCVCHK